MFTLISPQETELKIVFLSELVLQVKRKFGGVTSNIVFDFSKIKSKIKYTTPHTSGGVNRLYSVRYDPSENPLFGISFELWFTNNSGNQIYEWNPPDITYPRFMYLAEGETETIETPDRTIHFPPQETVEQFFERVWARLLHLTRRIRILRHEEPHQNALSEKICREVPENHDEVLRYDIACNLIKRPCGWLALQLENYQARYNRHLAAVETAKEAGRTPPTFNRGTDETKIQTMLDKLDANLTEECLQEHFDMHDHAEWDRVQNKQRKITLCDDDNSPGEVLVDVNAFFTDGRGRVAETHAKKTYHDISTKYWVMAKRTAHRNLVTERTVEMAE